MIFNMNKNAVWLALMTLAVIIGFCSVGVAHVYQTSTESFVRITLVIILFSGLIMSAADIFVGRKEAVLARIPLFIVFGLAAVFAGPIVRFLM